MIFYTGDIHGDPRPVKHFILFNSLTSDDLIIILGDAGLGFDYFTSELFHQFNNDFHFAIHPLSVWIIIK